MCGFPLGGRLLQEVPMKRTAQDILNFVEDNDVKFAKLTFCDIFGNQKKV